MGADQENVVWRRYNSRLYQCEVGHLCLAVGPHRVDNMHMRRVVLTQWRFRRDTLFTWASPDMGFQGTPANDGLYADLKQHGHNLHRFAGSCGFDFTTGGCGRAFMPRSRLGLGCDLVKLRAAMHDARDVIGAAFMTGGDRAALMLTASLDLPSPVFEISWRERHPSTGPIQVAR